MKDIVKLESAVEARCYDGSSSHFSLSSGTSLPSPPLPSPSLPFPPIPFPPRKSSIFPQMRPSPPRNVVKISTLKKIIIRDKICWYRSDMVFRSRKNPDRFGYSEPVILCHSCHYNLQDPVSVEWKSWVSYWVNFIHSDSMTQIVWCVILRVSNGM